MEHIMVLQTLLINKPIYTKKCTLFHINSYFVYSVKILFFGWEMLRIKSPPYPPCLNFPTSTWEISNGIYDPSDKY